MSLYSEALHIFLRYIIRLILALIAIPLIYLFAASILSWISTNPEAINCDQKEIIYLSTNGVHADFIIPNNSLDPRFLSELAGPKNAKYLSFGWGDKGFFINTPNWSDLKFSTAFSAMFLKSESAMHVDFFKNERASWTPVNLCQEQLSVLLNEIDKSFAKTRSGKLELIPDYQYGTWDKFFEGNGSYSLFNTCNSWVNRCLKKAEIKTAIWSPFDRGIIYQAKQNLERP